MKTKLTKRVLPLFLLLISLTSHAGLDSFYTDESQYFQKLTKNSFILRFSVDKDDCRELKSAELILKGTFNTLIPYPMKKLDSEELKLWPSSYNINPANYCWFSAEARGLNFNNSNEYTIKITTNSGSELYLNEVGKSIIPSLRLKSEVTTWLTPGSLGANKVKNGGVLFKVWEPEAESVDLKLNESKTYKLNTPINQAKVHWVYIPTAKAGDDYSYHFVKNGSYEVLTVGNNDRESSIKVDPMARELVYDEKGGEHNGYINPRAVVVEDKAFPWKNDHSILAINSIENHPWIIYQLWPLTFNPKRVAGAYVGGTFSDVAEKADYLQNLGVTAIEFLPVHESRFHASWGYALDSLTLIEKNYGSRNELKSLIDKLHGKNLKVIFDVVINHVNNSLIRDPLSKDRFNTKFYRGNTPWGPKPDFTNPMVRKWIVDSLINLTRNFHLDGMRFDMIETVYKGSKDGYKFVQELNILLKRVQPTFYSSAEQLPDNAWATYPIKEGGLAFDSQWNDKFKNFFELKFDHYGPESRFVDLTPIKGSLSGFSNHAGSNGEYHFGGATRTLNYLGSHDFVGNKNPFMRIFSGFESYESSGQNYFFRVRPLEIPNTSEREQKFRLIHNDFNHQAQLTSYGLLFTKPGASLFFQGEEFAGDLNIENEWSYINARENNSIPTTNVDINRYVGSHRVQWEYLTPRTSRELSFLTDGEQQLFEKYHSFFKDLIALRRSHPEIDLNDAQDVRECTKGILCYRLERGPNELFILINYGRSQKNRWIQFPGTATDWWHETLSLADSTYSNGQKNYLNVISNLGGRKNNVRMAGPSISIFTKKRNADIKAPLYLRNSLSGWKALEELRLQKASDRGDLYSATIMVKKSGPIKFKIGSSDWKIDIGKASSFFTPLPFLSDVEGFLSYVPGGQDASVELDTGIYDFLFNIKEFKYKFIKIREL